MFKVDCKTILSGAIYALVFGNAYGIVFEPQPTVRSYDTPIAAPAAKPTPFFSRHRMSSFLHQALAIRQESDATCGYLGADANSAYTCPSGYGCVYSTSASNGGNYGPFCCAGSTVCREVASTCLDYDENTVADETSRDGSLLCGSTDQVCATLYQRGTTYGENTPLFTSYFCTTSNYSRIAYQYVTTSADGGENSTTTVDLLTTSTTSSETTSSDVSSEEFSTSASEETGESGPATTGDPSVTSASSQDSTSSSAASQTAGGSSSNAAAIGGGVGGGVGGALLIAGIIGYLVRRKRQQRKEKVPEMAG